MTAQERPANAVSRPVSASQAPEVPVAGSTAQDDWRAALAAQLEEQFSYAAQYATVVLDWDEEADELAQSPALRDLLAERDTLAAQVQAVEGLHLPIQWQECTDGYPDLDKPLPPFCRECSDDEYVAAVEFGDTIDLGADVVTWPCPTRRALGTPTTGGGE